MSRWLRTNLAALASWVYRTLRRASSSNLLSLPLSETETRLLLAHSLHEESLGSFLLWRRSTLLLAGLITLFTPITQGLVALEVYWLTQYLWSTTGLVVQTIRHLALFVLPIASLIACWFWRTPTTSRLVLFLGWILSFLIPILLALIPTHWLFDLSTLSTVQQAEVLKEFLVSLEVPVNLDAGIERATQALNKAIDILGGLVNGFLLLPTILSLIPGLFRACGLVKTWFPESPLPGWSLMSITPLYCFGFLVGLVVVHQILGSVMVLLSGLLFTLVPVVYIVRIPLFLRPTLRQDFQQQFFFLRSLQALAVTASAILLGIYLHSIEIIWDEKGVRLFGLSEDTSLLQPWSFTQFLFEYLGRALYLTVLLTDLLVLMLVDSWKRTQTFLDTESAQQYDRNMEQLARILAPVQSRPLLHR